MKLSDTQLVILTAASQRDDRLALPLPERLKGGAAAKVVASLIAKGLVEEVDANLGDPIWRKTGDAHGVTLVVTDAARAVLGIEADDNPAKAGRLAAAIDDGGLVGGTPADKGRVAAMVEANDKARKQREPRKDSKQARLIAMLRRAKGATIDEIVEALDWQAHTVRGAIAGALKKKLGLNVVSEKSERRGRVYRITD
jgi:DNA-binding MarR family transcriptional regulator